jgi:hypothetical protein
VFRAGPVSRYGELDVAGNEVSKPARVLDGIQDLVNHLFGQSALFTEFSGAFPRFLVERLERGIGLAQGAISSVGITTALR